MSQMALLKQCSSPHHLQAGGASYPRVGTRYWQPFSRDPIVEDVGRDSQRQRGGCRMHLLEACADDQWNGPRQSLDRALMGVPGDCSSSATNGVALKLTTHT